MNVTLVDQRGRSVSTQVVMPRLEIQSPRSEVRIPYADETDDFRIGPRAALGAPSGEPLASLDPVTAELHSQVLGQGVQASLLHRIGR